MGRERLKPDRLHCADFVALVAIGAFVSDPALALRRQHCIESLRKMSNKNKKM